jgi:hypothetical protein
VEVFLPARVNARYVLQACNGSGCTDSAPVSVVGTLAEAVGYLKASNTGAADEFGSGVALSSDGNTLAVGARYEDSRASSGTRSPSRTTAIPLRSGHATKTSLMAGPTSAAQLTSSPAVPVSGRSRRTWLRQNKVRTTTSGRASRSRETATPLPSARTGNPATPPVATTTRSTTVPGSAALSTSLPVTEPTGPSRLTSRRRTPRAVISSAEVSRFRRTAIRWPSAPTTRGARRPVSMAIRATTRPSRAARSTFSAAPLENGRSKPTSSRRTRSTPFISASVSRCRTTEIRWRSAP